MPPFVHPRRQHLAIGFMGVIVFQLYFQFPPELGEKSCNLNPTQSHNHKWTSSHRTPVFLQAVQCIETVTSLPSVVWVGARSHPAWCIAEASAVTGEGLGRGAPRDEAQNTLETEAQANARPPPPPSNVPFWFAPHPIHPPSVSLQRSSFRKF